MKIGVTLLTILVIGCAFFPPIKPLSPGENQRIYSHDYETTWRVVLEALIHREMPVATIEKKKGNIVTDYVLVDMNTPSGSRLFPSHKMFEKVLQGRYKLNVSVKPIGEKTSVTIDAHYERLSQVTDVMGGEDSPTWKPQNSPGIIESQLFDEISSVLSESY